MRTDKFTVKSQEAIQKAQDFAQQKGNQQVDVEHLFHVLLEEGIALEIIQKLGLDIALLKKEIEAEIGKIPKVLGPSPVGQLYITQELKNVYEAAFKEAEHLKDDYVSVEHLLLGIIRTKNRSEKSCSICNLWNTYFPCHYKFSYGCIHISIRHFPIFSKGEELVQRWSNQH